MSQIDLVWLLSFLVCEGKRDQRFRNNSSSSSQTSEVKRCAYCDIHTPLEVLSPRTRKSIGAAQSAADCEEAMKEAQKQRMRKARKILAERRDAPPQVCMPVIHAEKIQVCSSDKTQNLNFSHDKSNMLFKEYHGPGRFWKQGGFL